jgi:hypothetical protein
MELEIETQRERHDRQRRELAEATERENRRRRREERLSRRAADSAEIAQLRAEVEALHEVMHEHDMEVLNIMRTVILPTIEDIGARVDRKLAEMQQRVERAFPERPCEQPILRTVRN